MNLYVDSVNIQMVTLHLGQWSPKCTPQTSSISTTWEPVETPVLGLPLRPPEQDSGMGSAVWVVTPLVITKFEDLWCRK